MIAPRRTIHEVLVIGSGASGGWVAKELTEQGDRRCSCWRPARRAFPPAISPSISGPISSNSAASAIRKRFSTNQPVQRLCYACDEYSHQFFVNDNEHPYTFPADKPFMWIRGRQVGGKTFCWARESYRYSDYEFKAASRDGYGEDWPISYKDLEPYYDRVESYIGVSGSREGLPQLPDGKFLPPMSLSCGELRASEDHREEIRLEADRPIACANLTVPHQWPPGVPLLRPVPARLLTPLLISTAHRLRCPPRRAPAGFTW